MPTGCCVPQCHQKGVKSPTGEKVLFFAFPKSPERRKQWIHAIRRDEGKQWQITPDTKVCSLHFRREDLRTSLNSRQYIAERGVPSRFAWSVPSPTKRKAPTERISVPMKKKLFTPEVSSETNDEGSTAPETVHVDSGIPDLACQTSEMDQIK